MGQISQQANLEGVSLTVDVTKLHNFVEELERIRKQFDNRITELESAVDRIEKKLEQKKKNA